MKRVFAEQYETIFARPWPVWGAAVLAAVTNVFLFAFDRPFPASDGVRNWGDWAFTGLGVVKRPDLIAPWLYSGSLLNLGVIAGALVGAILSSQLPLPGPARRGL